MTPSSGDVPNAGRPRLIAFEGVDGAGKSTVIRNVTAALRERGVPVFLPRTGKEHDSYPTRMIRRLTRDSRNLALTGRAELGLYCAREAQILEEMVRPALARGETVLLDRSLMTPVVLGAWGRGLPRRECETVAAAASGGLEPDLTLVFDVHPRTSRIRKRIEKLRSRSREPGGRKGLSGTGLKERVREGYVTLAAERGYPLFHVERASPAELSDRVLQVIDGTARPAELETEHDRVPVWQVPEDWSLERALGALPGDVALFLANGLIMGRALRESLLDREPELAAWSMDPDDPLREAAAALAPDYALRGLAHRPLSGPDDLRLRLLFKAPGAAIASLRFLSGDVVDRLRREHVEDLPGAVASSLTAREDPVALDLRQLAWKKSGSSDRASSLIGCGGETAWRLREELLEDDPVLGVISLRGVRNARGDAILEGHAENAPRPVLRALAGRFDPFAHALRARLRDTGRELIDSVRGLDDEESWQLREEFAERWPSTVLHSLAGIPNGPRVEALAARCERVSRGDMHVARRRESLREYSRLPAWARTRLGMDDEPD